MVLILKITIRGSAKFAQTLLVIAVNIIINSHLKDNLKFIFGRSWPETWHHNNPSWIQNHVYGMHFFHGGDIYNSFPSGHSAVTFAAITILWLAYPRYRVLYAIICSAILISLLGMDYHFLGDLIAGSFLGIITGIYAKYFLDQASNKL